MAIFSDRSDVNLPDDGEKPSGPADLILPAPPEQARERQAEVLRRSDDEIYRETMEARPASLQATFTGPLPSPRALKDYDEAVPGLAERLITALEKEGEHRRKEQSLDGATNRALALKESHSQRLGVLCGFGVSIAGFVTAYEVAKLGYPGVGAIIGTVDLVALAGVFVFGRAKAQRDDEKDRDGGR